MSKPDKDMQRVMKEVDVHAVIDDETSAMIEVHTHGLNAYGQAELQVIANSLFVCAATHLLNTLAFAVIIRGERFKAGENCDYGREYGWFTLEEKKDSAGSSVLRIIPYARHCDVCEAERVNGS